MEEIYFGVKKTKKFYLDEKKEQWIEFKKLTEGELIKYEDSLGGKVVMDSQTQKAEVENKIGSDRMSLIELAVCSYNVRTGEGETGIISGYDINKWRELYQVMDGDMAKKLFDDVKAFNGIGKKKG